MFTEKRLGFPKVLLFQQATSGSGNDEEEVVIEVPQDPGPNGATVWSNENPPVNISTSDVPASGATVIYTPDPGKH